LFILETIKTFWAILIDLVISFRKSINIVELIILFGMCSFIPWVSDKSKERKRKKLEIRNKEKNLEKDDLNELKAITIESSPTQDLEQNTKLWWNLEGWKNEGGWIGPDPIIPGNEKIHKIKDDECIGK
jgi:hypothetical protein